MIRLDLRLLWLKSTEFVRISDTKSFPKKIIQVRSKSPRAYVYIVDKKKRRISNITVLNRLKYTSIDCVLFCSPEIKASSSVVIEIGSLVKYRLCSSSFEDIEIESDIICGYTIAPLTNNHRSSRLFASHTPTNLCFEKFSEKYFLTSDLRISGLLPLHSYPNKSYLALKGKFCCKTVSKAAPVFGVYTEALRIKKLSPLIYHDCVVIPRNSIGPVLRFLLDKETNIEAACVAFCCLQENSKTMAPKVSILRDMKKAFAAKKALQQRYYSKIRSQLT